MVSTMSDKRVFTGTLCDVRNIPSRKIVKFIVEVPSELAFAAMKAMGGWPQSDNPFHVAVAVLHPSKSQNDEVDMSQVWDEEKEGVIPF